MKRIVILLLLTLFVFSSHAEIYKGTDAEGNVTYSDEKSPNSTEIKVPEITTIPMPKPKPKEPKKEEKEEEKPYESFLIKSPVDDETIRTPLRDIVVTLSIKPELDLKQQHSINVYIDGFIVAEKAEELTLPIPNVVRGSHEVRAEVIDAEENILIKSKAVKFHLKRPSSQHNNPQGSKAGPKRSDGSQYKPGPTQAGGTPYTPGPTRPDGTPYTPGPTRPDGTPYTPGPVTATPIP